MKNNCVAMALGVLGAVIIGSSAFFWIRIGELSAKLENTHATKQNSSRERNKPLAIEKLMCARSNWCGIDFFRLAAHPEVLIGKRVYILGYLAVDGGIVSLFASEEDYMKMETGRSIEIMGGRNELTALVEAHGNKYVRIEGTYEPPPVGRGRSGRLGSLAPPIMAREFHARSITQGATDILIRARYPDSVTR